MHRYQEQISLVTCDWVRSCAQGLGKLPPDVVLALGRSPEDSVRQRSDLFASHIHRKLRDGECAEETLAHVERSLSCIHLFQYQVEKETQGREKSAFPGSKRILMRSGTAAPHANTRRPSEEGRHSAPPCIPVQEDWQPKAWAPLHGALLSLHSLTVWLGRVPCALHEALVLSVERKLGIKSLCEHHACFWSYAILSGTHYNRVWALLAMRQKVLLALSEMLLARIGMQLCLSASFELLESFWAGNTFACLAEKPNTLGYWCRFLDAFAGLAWSRSSSQGERTLALHRDEIHRMTETLRGLATLRADLWVLPGAVEALGVAVSLLVDVCNGTDTGASARSVAMTRDFFLTFGKELVDDLAAMRNMHCR